MYEKLKKAMQREAGWAKAGHWDERRSNYISWMNKR